MLSLDAAMYAVQSICFLYSDLVASDTLHLQHSLRFLTAWYSLSRCARPPVGLCQLLLKVQLPGLQLSRQLLGPPQLNLALSCLRLLLLELVPQLQNLQGLHSTHSQLQDTCRGCSHDATASWLPPQDMRQICCCYGPRLTA